jgi:uncharacterized protein YqfA (UPF0365 family)
MLVEYLRQIDMHYFTANINVFFFMLGIILVAAAIIFCFVVTVDYFGYRVRIFSISIFKKSHNLILLEAKYRKVSKKKVIEDIINNHYRDFNPDNTNRIYNKHNLRNRHNYR